MNECLTYFRRFVIICLFIFDGACFLVYITTVLLSNTDYLHDIKLQYRMLLLCMVVYSGADLMCGFCDGELITFKIARRTNLCFRKLVSYLGKKNDTTIKLDSNHVLDIV